MKLINLIPEAKQRRGLYELRDRLARKEVTPTPYERRLVCSNGQAGRVVSGKAE